MNVNYTDPPQYAKRQLFRYLKEHVNKYPILIDYISSWHGNCNRTWRSRVVLSKLDENDKWVDFFRSDGPKLDYRKKIIAERAAATHALDELKQRDEWSYCCIL